MKQAFLQQTAMQPASPRRATARMAAGGAAALLVGSLVGLGACNTVRGAGEDIQSVGKATERTAERTGAEDDGD